MVLGIWLNHKRARRNKLESIGPVENKESTGFIGRKRIQTKKALNWGGK
jgi:hypothetical protein